MEKERLLQVTNIPHMPGNDPAAPNNKLQPQDSKSTIGASQLGHKKEGKGIQAVTAISSPTPVPISCMKAY
jgi:hypothetical protein